MHALLALFPLLLSFLGHVKLDVLLDKGMSLNVVGRSVYFLKMNTPHPASFHSWPVHGTPRGYCTWGLQPSTRRQVAATIPMCQVLICINVKHRAFFCQLAAAMGASPSPSDDTLPGETLMERTDRMFVQQVLCYLPTVQLRISHAHLALLFLSGSPRAWAVI